MGLTEEQESASYGHHLGRREQMIWRSHVGNPGRMETGRKKASGQGQLPVGSIVSVRLTQFPHLALSLELIQ